MDKLKPPGTFEGRISFNLLETWPRIGESGSNASSCI